MQAHIDKAGHKRKSDDEEDEDEEMQDQRPPLKRQKMDYLSVMIDDETKEEDGMPVKEEEKEEKKNKKKKKKKQPTEQKVLKKRGRKPKPESEKKQRIRKSTQPQADAFKIELTSVYKCPDNPAAITHTKSEVKQQQQQQTFTEHTIRFVRRLPSSGQGKHDPTNYVVRADIWLVLGIPDNAAAERIRSVFGKDGVQQLTKGRIRNRYHKNSGQASQLLTREQCDLALATFSETKFRKLKHIAQHLRGFVTSAFESLLKDTPPIHASADEDTDSHSSGSDDDNSDHSDKDL